MFDESQKAMSIRLNDKISRLQEANSCVFANIAREEAEMRQVVEILENLQDLSLEINQQVIKKNYLNLLIKINFRLKNLIWS